MADNPYFPTERKPVGFGEFTRPNNPIFPMKKPFFPEPKKEESNFWHGLTYGATGYKPHVDADEETFGRIVGEIGGFVVANTLLRQPVAAAASKLAGLKALKPAVGAKRSVDLWASKRGQALIQKLGYSPERARYLTRVAGQDLQMEMAFQTGKLGVGYVSGTEDASVVHKGAEIGLIGALTPAGTLGVDKIGRAAKRWYKKKYKPEEVHAENQIGRVVKPDDAESPIEFPKGEKDVDVVKATHDQEYIKAQLEWLDDTARGILKKVGIATERETPLPKPDNNAPADPKPWRDSEGYKKTQEANRLDRETHESLTRTLRRNLIGRSSNLRADLNKWVEGGKLSKADADAILREYTIQFNTVSTANYKFGAAHEAIWEKLPKELWEDLDAYATARVTRSVVQRKMDEALDQIDLVERRIEDIKATRGEIPNIGSRNAAELKRLDDELAKAQSELDALNKSYLDGDWKPNSMMKDDEWAELIESIRLRSEAGESSAKMVRQAADTLFDFVRKEITQGYYDAGLISHREYELLMQNDYLPREFIHLFNKGMFRSKTSPDSMYSGTPASAPKDIKQGASGPQRVDARLLLRQAIGQAESAIQRQRIGQELIDVALRDPTNGLIKVANFIRPEGVGPPKGWQPKTVEEVFEIPDGAKFLEEPERALHPVTVRDPATGDIKKIELSLDRDLARDIAEPNPHFSRGIAKLIRLTSLNTLLKKSVVEYNWVFGGVINPILDGLSQYMKDTTYRSPIFHRWAKEMFEDMRVVWKDANDHKGLWYNAYARNGGSVSSVLSNEAGSGTPLTMKDWLAESAKPVHSTLQKLHNFGSKYTRNREMLLRLAMFRRSIKHQLGQLEKQGVEVPDLEAVLSARTGRYNEIVRKAVYDAADYVNFADDAGWVRAIDTWTPFFQAHVSVLRPQLRAWAHDPERQAAKVFQLTAAGMALYLFNHAMFGEEQDKIPSHHRANYYTLMTPYTSKTQHGKESHLYIKLPKDSGSAPFINIGQMTMRKILTGRNPDEGSLQELADSLGTYAGVSPFSAEYGVNPRFFTPPIAQAFIAYFNNKDIWWNQDIWSPYKQVAPEQEIKPGTSALATDVGQAIGASPARLERTFEKIFGAQNPFLDALGLGYKAFASSVSDNPVEQATFANEIIPDFFSLGKRVFGYTPAYRSKVFDITGSASEEIQVKRQDANQALGNMLNGVKQGVYDYNDVNRFLIQFDPEEQKRLSRQVKFFKSSQNLMHFPILRSLALVPPQGRAKAAYAIYRELPEEDRASYLKELKIFPSLITRDNFWDEFNAAQAIETGRGIERDAPKPALPR